MEFNFKTLLEPYAEPDEKGVPRRNIEGVIKWLGTRHGLPRDVIDRAILKVFNEMESGLVFEADEKESGGHKLDQYLLKTAQEVQKSDLSKQAAELEVFMTTFKQQAVEQYVKAQRGSAWKRIKAVFKPT